MPDRDYTFDADFETQVTIDGIFQNGGAITASFPSLDALTTNFGTLTDVGQVTVEKNYENLSNKPQINGVTLTGNKTGSALSLINTTDVITTADIDAIVAED